MHSVREGKYEMTFGQYTAFLNAVVLNVLPFLRVRVFAKLSETTPNIVTKSRRLAGA